MKLLFFKNQKELDYWFENKHENDNEIWIGYYKKHTKKESITWDESVEEALKYGWIDGIRKSINDRSYKIRFTLRKENSNWSLKNIKTIEELIKKDLVKEKGLQIYQKRKEQKIGIYAFEQRNKELSKAYLREFKKNKSAWDYFENEKPYYKKIAIYWVMSAKKEETRKKRLNTLRNDTLIKFAFIRRNFIFQQGKKPAYRQAGVDNAGH